MRNRPLRTFSLVLVGATVMALVAAAPSSARTPKIKKAGAPTAVHAVGVNEGAVVFWSAPASNGGSPITGYTVTAPPRGGGKTCVTTGALECRVTLLTNGHQYTIKV